MKLIRFISVLFFGLLFVLPVASVATEAKSRYSEFSEGDRDPPPFVCRQIKDPNLNLNKKRNGFSATSLLETGVEYNENTLVILAVPSDKEDGADFSEKEKEAREAVFDGENSAKNYLLEMLEVEFTGSVFNKLVVLPKTSEKYAIENVDNFDTQAILRDVISATDDSVDFRYYGRIIIFTRGQHNFGYGTVGQWSIETDEGELLLGVVWIGEDDMGNKGMLWHEILHTEGLEHSGSTVLDYDDCGGICSYFTRGSDSDWPLVQCATYESDDPFDVMGLGDCYTSMYHLWLLGHLKEEQISRITETANVILIPRSSSVSGIKMALIEIKATDGEIVFYFIEYYKNLGNFDSAGDKSRAIVRYASEDNINGNDTLIFRKKKEDGSGYGIFDMKDGQFCDSTNGVKIELLGEYGEGENSYVEFQVALEESSTPTPSPSLASSPTPTPTTIPSPTLIPTLPPIPTPSLNPTLSPVPTPEPTVTSEEMTLSVTINGQDATMNNIVVAKKKWMEVEVKARNSRGTILQANRIDCKITNSKGKRVFLSRYNVKGVFLFMPQKKGKYSLKMKVFKEGFQTASFQAKFKVE